MAAAISHGRAPHSRRPTVRLVTAAPADCKKFVKVMCHNASIPDTSRLQMCAGYVTTINQMVQRQGAQSADACKAMANSGPQ